MFFRKKSKNYSEYSKLLAAIAKEGPIFRD